MLVSTSATSPPRPVMSGSHILPIIKQYKYKDVDIPYTIGVL